MILYTPLCPEDIFQDNTTHSRPVSASYNGCSVSLSAQDDGSYTLENLNSTNPMDFLNPMYAPGLRIDGKDVSFE